MAELTTLDPDTDLDEILSVFQRDGGVIVRDAINSDLVDRISEETRPWVDATPSGRDDFTGRKTSRTGALVARSAACREAVLHETTLEMAKRYLEPFSNKIHLHLTQIIKIGPGQGHQPLHRDRLAWGGYIPRTIEPQFNTMWALTDFTEENGATRVVPTSNHWPDERRAEPDEITQAVMSAGSVLFYSGSVVHSGGENQTDQDRHGLNITYCLSWLRTEENQYLSCPPDVAKDLEPRLQDLLGYTMANYALGYYSDPQAVGEKADIRGPEMAVGRQPDPSVVHL